MQRLADYVAAVARDARRSGDPDPVRLLGERGIAVHTRRLASVRGFELPGQVFVADGLDPREYRFTLAHELGHALQRAGSLVTPARYTEWAADLFASELLLPQALIARHPYAPVPDRARTWQLSRAGLGPRLTVVPGAVICRECGWRRISRTCECARVRRRHTSAITSQAS